MHPVSISEALIGRTEFKRSMNGGVYAHHLQVADREAERNMILSTICIHILYRKKVYLHECQTFC